MAKRYEKAELLAALWKLGANEERLPTSHGILDRALKQCLPELPEQLRAGLTFGVTGVGLRCYELPDILLAAQEAMLTSEPNPTYLSSIVTIDQSRARQIVVSYGMSTSQAKSIGERLRLEVSSIRMGLAQEPEPVSVAK
jgi:hypothetical protein